MLDAENKLIAELKKVISDFNIGDVVIEIGTPRSQSYGDLSSNLALKLSKPLNKNPEELANDIVEKIRPDFEDVFEKIEVAPPGFINFYFSLGYLQKLLTDVIKKREGFASNNLGKKRKVLIEFVSANPTGPLSIAHGMQAAIGGSLARILEFAGYDVDKEYYINDEGTQIDLFGASLKARCLEALGEKLELPENGYQGEYLIELADKLIAKEGRSVEKIEKLHQQYFSKFAVREMTKEIKEELINFGVKFDYWSSQREVGSGEEIDKIINEFKSKDLIYNNEGAVWFKSTQFGDDQDRVVKRADGRFTYFASDIAYHKVKFDRKYDLLIDIWGPDHHGYIQRVKAAVEALGYDKEILKILIVQLATLYRGGKLVKLSTRRGETLTLKEVVEEIGRDVAIYFLLSRKLDSHLDFDLELAKKQSMDNPVYYIQYAYARIYSILDFAAEKNIVIDDNPSDEVLKCLKEEGEKVLLRTIAQFPRIVKIITITLDPSLLTVYLHDLASKFHSFYDKYRVVTDSPCQTHARLYLCVALKHTLSKGLALLGISSPQKM